MKRMKRWTIGAAFAFAATAAQAYESLDPAADAALEQRSIAAHAAWVERTVPVLATRDDALSQFYAAFLPQMIAHATGKDAKSAATRDRYAEAFRRAHDDRLALWLLANGCRAGACNAKAAVDRLLEMEPDNAAAWHLAFDPRPPSQEAPASGEDEVDRLLEGMAKADHYDFPFDPLIAATYEVLEDVAPTPADIAELDGSEVDPKGVPLLLAYAYVLSIGIPAYSSLVDPCSPSHERHAARAASCTRIAELLAESNTAIGRSIGIAILAKLADDDAAREAVFQRHVRHAWMMHAGSEVKLGGVDASDDAAHITAELAELEHIRKGVGEVARMERFLREANVSLDPPEAFVAEQRRLWESRR